MTTGSYIRRVLLLLWTIQWACRCSTGELVETRYDDFSRLINAGKTEEATELGDQLFKALVKRDPNSAVLSSLTKRLAAAQQIDADLARGTRSSSASLLQGIAGMEDLGLPAPASSKKDMPAALPPSARQMYWNHLRTFSGELTLNSLPVRQSTFLSRYYPLCMRDSIMKIGRQVAVADPNSSQSVSYAIVLPLLYSNGRDSVWNEMGTLLALFSPSQLGVLSKFSLIEAERPKAALTISQQASKATGESFSSRAWAFAAADTCVANHRPDLAEKALYVVMGDIKDKGEVAEFRTRAADGYAKCNDYIAAAEKCRQVLSDLPESPSYGKSMATYLGYLARGDDAEQVAKETASTVSDARCKPYLAQILYLRWWARARSTSRTKPSRSAGS